ncbi:MAG: PfkB family carbohydrate kinase [Candidatus Thorarchaeota archaeon]
MKLIVLGSITEDIIITPTKEVHRFIGGVPIYAASTAKAFSETIGIVSKVGTDFHIKNLKAINSLGADLNGFSIAGSSSMCFENTYTKKGTRKQRVLSISEKITISDIPSIYRSVPCIHLGPVLNEVDPSLISDVRSIFQFVSLDGQGFTRKLDPKSKKVVLEPWLDYEEYLPQINALKVDDLELKGIIGTKDMDEAIEKALNTGLEFLIITRAHNGAIIFHNGERYDIPAFPTTVVDSTGAGDTFMTAFLLEYYRTKDCYFSGLAAACAASFKISTSGPEPAYLREDVYRKMKGFNSEMKFF